MSWILGVACEVQGYFQWLCSKELSRISLMYLIFLETRIIGLHFPADTLCLSSFIIFLVGAARLFYFYFSHSRSSKVDEFGANGKRICDFLLVRNGNLGPILHRFGVMTVFMCSWPHPYSTLNLRVFPSHQIPHVDRDYGGQTQGSPTASRWLSSSSGRDKTNSWNIKESLSDDANHQTGRWTKERITPEAVRHWITVDIHKQSPLQIYTAFMATAADAESTLPRCLFCVVGTSTSGLGEAEVVESAHVNCPCTFPRQPAEKHTG